MKSIIKKTIVALFLYLGITTAMQASGGATDYNPGNGDIPGCHDDGRPINGILPNTESQPQPQTYISDLRTSVRSTNDAPETMERKGEIYHKIPINLNEGAGGKYIYLYYTETTDPYYGYGQLYVTAHPYDFTELYSDVWKLGKSFANGMWTDLNQGAGGDYVKISGVPIIKFIQAGITSISIPYQLVQLAAEGNPYVNYQYVITKVTVARSTDYITPDWHQIKVDLNKGAGGSYLYLYYQAEWVPVTYR